MNKRKKISTQDTIDSYLKSFKTEPSQKKLFEFTLDCSKNAPYKPNLSNRNTILQEIDNMINLRGKWNSKCKSIDFLKSFQSLELAYKKGPYLHPIKKGFQSEREYQLYPTVHQKPIPRNMTKKHCSLYIQIKKPENNFKRNKGKKCKANNPILPLINNEKAIEVLRNNKEFSSSSSSLTIKPWEVEIL